MDFLRDLVPASKKLIPLPRFVKVKCLFRTAVIRSQEKRFIISLIIFVRHRCVNSSQRPRRLYVFTADTDKWHSQKEKGERESGGEMKHWVRVKRKITGREQKVHIILLPSLLFGTPITVKDEDENKAVICFRLRGNHSSNPATLNPFLTLLFFYSRLVLSGSLTSAFPSVSGQPIPLSLLQSCLFNTVTV